MIRKITSTSVFVVLICLLMAMTFAVSDWQQVGGNGFGDPLAEEISAVSAFDGYLYAGTGNPTNDARIFRSVDGLTWQPVIDPGFGSAHDTAPRAILDMTVFNGRLYASTGRGNAAQIWRTVNGTSWARVVNAGFGDPDVTDISALAEYKSLIYAGATSAVTGAQIWRSYTGDSNSWTQVAPNVAGPGGSRITGMTIFGGAIYAAVEIDADTPVQIWRSTGGSWETIVVDGFGNNKTVMAGGLTAFAGYLYVGAGNTQSGAQLWRTPDGANWEQMITSAFGNANNEVVEAVTVYQDQLYVTVRNQVTGIEVWRSGDGSVWEQNNQDGFGDSNNTGTNSSNAAVPFGAQFYVGTVNVAAGGELWRTQQSFGVALSADEALMGSVGQTVTYTMMITNTGTTADIYTLTVTANNWATSLSSTLLALDPGSSQLFTATVTIPNDVSGGATDAATITATSQGDAAIKDSAVLTTTCLWQAYLPFIRRTP